VLTLKDASTFVDRERRAGRTIVFTNGVFDLLHIGHLRYLRYARSLGDALVVGVNADASVRRLGKGADRPVTPENDRAEILSGLSCVDAVIIFGEDTPAGAIDRLQPDVLVKGADWEGRDIPGRDSVERRGGRVVFAPFEAGYSTTLMLDTIKKSPR
jgi:D-beta-D-heptose 7-phosphate kinase/D-beta-D-heptose 1-phosphate adenosyltransferase